MTIIRTAYNIAIPRNFSKCFFYFFLSSSYFDQSLPGDLIIALYHIFQENI